MTTPYERELEAIRAEQELLPCVYRVEDREGRGPFRPGFSHVWRSADGNDFPPPWVEAGLTVSEFQALFEHKSGHYYGCACKSEKQLREWFSRSELRRLKRLGYRVATIEPTAIILETPTQVVFEARKAWNTRHA